MNTNDIGILLKKADELRSLFVLGQRVIPFLEEIFVFVQDIQPMLEEINRSIDENIQKMPGASEKLSKVTEANELATTEIMDTLDKMFDITNTMTSNNGQITEHYEKVIDKPLRLLEILRKGIHAKQDLGKAIPQIDSAISKIKAFSSKKIEPLQTENKELIDEINNSASAIMMSLQVQDITSQQIAAVDHMLSAVQGKLSEILNHFKNTDVGSLVDTMDIDTDTSDAKFGTNTSKLHREIAFDPNAIGSYDNNEERQKMVDELIDAKDDIVSDNNPQGQDDIDAMFNAAGFDDLDDDSEDLVSEESTEMDTELEEELDQEILDDENTEQAVEEIEELELSDDPQGQDDIDAMFNQIKDEEEPELGDLQEESEVEDKSDENLENSSEIDVSQFDELGENPDSSDIDAMFNQLGGDEEESKDESSAEGTNDEEEFDLSKFDSLGDNPDPNDIDALFNGS